MNTLAQLFPYTCPTRFPLIAVSVVLDVPCISSTWPNFLIYLWST